MAEPTFMNHNGKQILYIDFSECGPQELIARIKESGRITRSQPEASLLTLTYVRNARFDRKVTQALKDYTNENKPYVRAAAVVGMSGLMQVILNAIVVFTRRKFATFESVDEAKEWLARH
jgi:hypothetical protein